MAMNRRGFLSMVPVVALSAVIPKRSYFFMDGLWKPEQDISGLTILLREAWRTINGKVYVYRYFNGRLFDVQITPFERIPFIEAISGSASYPFEVRRPLGEGVRFADAEHSHE